MVLAGRNLEPLQEVVAASVAPERGHAVSADVTQESSVVSLFDAALKKYGRIDMLFNNAGRSAPPGVLLCVPCKGTVDPSVKVRPGQLSLRPEAQGVLPPTEN